MHIYEINLLRKNGLRDCVLSLLCARDRSAIMLAKSIFRMNRNRAARVVVWREDEMIFEAPEPRRLH